jgi:hypothetical protein
MVSKTPYHQRPRLIGERLGNHFGDVDPDAKRVWALIVQLSVLFREKNNPKLKSEGIALSRGEIIILTALRLEGRHMNCARQILPNGYKCHRAV